MVQDIDKYAKMAGSLGISASVLEQTQGIFEAVPEIMQDFSNPANELTAKHNVIDRVFNLDGQSSNDQPVSGYLRSIPQPDAGA